MPAASDTGLRCPSGSKPAGGQEAGLQNLMTLLQILQSGQGPAGGFGAQSAPRYTPPARYSTGAYGMRR